MTLSAHIPTPEPPQDPEKDRRRRPDPTVPGDVPPLPPEREPPIREPGREPPVQDPPPDEQPNPKRY